MTARQRPSKRWGVLAASALLAATLLFGIYLLAGLTTRLAAGWANRPRPTPRATLPKPTPYPTRVRVGAPTATRIPLHTPVPTATAAPNATPVPATADCFEVLRDGGFEAGEDWDIVNTAYSAGYVNKPAAYVTNPVHSGERALRLGITESPDVYSYSAAEQIVTIPADATSARLSVWLYLMSADRTDDGQYVLILKGTRTDDERASYDTLMWELTDSPSWQHREFSLDAYRGQTVRVHFEVHNDGDGALTAMYVDDVTLTICREPES